MPERIVFAVLLSIAPLVGVSHAAEQQDRYRGGQYEGGRHEHNFPPAMYRFHEVMAPLVHSSPGEARRVAICEQSTHLNESGQALARSGEGKTESWNANAQQLAELTLQLTAECADGGFDAEPMLGQIHHAFHGLMRADRR